MRSVVKTRIAALETDKKNVAVARRLAALQSEQAQCFPTAGTVPLTLINTLKDSTILEAEAKDRAIRVQFRNN